MDLNVKLQGLKYNYEKVQGCFCKIPMFMRFSGFMELFSLRRIRRICPQHRGPGPPMPVHGSTNFIKRRSLASGSTTQLDPSEPLSRLLISVVHHRSDGRSNWLRPGVARAHARGNALRPSTMAHRSSNFLELRWSVFDEVCSYGIIATRGEHVYANLNRQRPATERRLSRCLSMVRAASSEASFLRTCAKASSSSLPASRIWWLSRVRWVLNFRPKIRTICDAIYRGF
jgi:hypothetical protein